jgi:hypothetical protein
LRGKKSEPEQTIRRLCAVWAASKGISIPARGKGPNFIEFERWLADNDYGHLLDGLSMSGARNDVRRWFNDEFDS